MPTTGRRDDATDEYLRARGWFSRRQHGERHGYRAGYDSWGWAGAEPGSITITCLGQDRYEAAWTSAETGEPVIEELRGPDAARARALELEQHTDYIPN